METHVRILAAIHIVLGILGALIAVGCLLLFGGLAGLMGMQEVPQDPDAIVGVWALGIIGTVIFVVVAVLSIPSIIAGLGLLQFRNWARILTIVLSAIGLLNVPIGTAAGVYGLWVLLNTETEALFNRQQLRPAAQA